MSVRIIGAGMAGLLAAHMLQRRKPVVYELAKSLPNNHSAVLRFRSGIVGDTLGIPFRSVQMLKATLPWRNPVADILAYSYKNTTVRRSDRSVTQGLVTDTRWMAPTNLIEQMADGINIVYELNGLDAIQCQSEHEGPIISTLPLSAVLATLEYPRLKEVNPDAFVARPGINITATIADCDAYVSLLVPDPNFIFSRLSITGNEMIIECPTPFVNEPEVIEAACHLLGIAPFDVTNTTSKLSRYQKILPLDDHWRKEAIFWLTEQHNIYSLGRFSTHRPGLLLDDLVPDIRRIDQWIGKKDAYARSKSR